MSKQNNPSPSTQSLFKRINSNIIKHEILEYIDLKDAYVLLNLCRKMRDYIKSSSITYKRYVLFCEMNKKYIYYCTKSEMLNSHRFIPFLHEAVSWSIKIKTPPNALPIIDESHAYVLDNQLLIDLPSKKLLEAFDFIKFFIAPCIKNNSWTSLWLDPYYIHKQVDEILIFLLDNNPNFNKITVSFKNAFKSNIVFISSFYCFILISPHSV